MKAQELRIGNYIMVEYNEKHKDLLVRVIEINSDSVKYAAIDNGNRLLKGGTKGECIFDTIMPIPITEDWFRKFGIAKFSFGDKYYFSEGQITGGFEGVWRYEIEDERYTTEITSFKYVHQLQNIYYALTGEELISK